MYENVDIFQQGGSADKDLLDIVVEGYEENVPLPAQMLAGLTLPGIGMDIAAAGKYGRDAPRDIREGKFKQAAISGGIAGLSALGAIPILGDLAKGPKSALKKGLASLDDSKALDERAVIRAHQADLNTGNPLADAYKMRARAERLSPEFQEFTQNMARSLDLETTLPEISGKFGSVGEPFGTLKGIPRMIEKTRDKYKGDISALTDPMRTRVVVNTPAEEEAFVRLLGDSGYQFFDKGRVVKPEGFVDRKINLAFTGSNGEPLVAEIALITAPMWRASTKQHDFYEEFRALLPDGMPTTAAQRRMINDETFAKAKELDDKMKQIFSDAKNQIDPAFYDELDIIKKFACGGYVTAGSSGRSAPMTPNLLSKASFDIFEPSNKKSANCFGVATDQSNSFSAMKKPSLPSSYDSITAGPSSHVKYNLSITPSLQKFTNNYNPNDVNIFEVE